MYHIKMIGSSNKCVQLVIDICAVQLERPNIIATTVS